MIFRVKVSIARGGAHLLKYVHKIALGNRTKGLATFDFLGGLKDGSSPLSHKAARAAPCTNGADALYCGYMHTRIEEKNDQHLWNFFFSALFAVILTLSVLYLARHEVLPASIPLLDAVLIALAVFRITRLLVYDRITLFLRDSFLRSRVIKDDAGNTLVERVSYKTGPFRTIHDLFDCPWCVGVWVSLAVVFSYFVFSFAWYVIFFLAVAGLGSLLQLAGSLIGWKAENLKFEAKERGSAQKDR